MNTPHHSAPSLREVQLAMAAWIAPASGAERPAALPQWLQLPAGVDPRQRLDVYADGYPARVLESLRESYPALSRWLGDESLADLARRYVAAAPPTSYNLNDAGAQLSRFLCADAAFCEQPFLADLAELEWQVTRAFHADEQPPLDPQRLGWSIAEWERAVLVFQPAVTLVTSRWPILDLWNVEADSDAPALVARPRPQRVLVYRAGLTVRAELVPGSESRMLRSLLDGYPLGDAAARIGDDADPDVFAQCFSRWVQQGLIADARIPQPDLAA